MSEYPQLLTDDYNTTDPTHTVPPSTPSVIWFVYYLGYSERWILSPPCFEYEIATRISDMLQRPSRILKYSFVKDEKQIQIIEKVTKTVKQQVVVKKIRKVV